MAVRIEHDFPLFLADTVVLPSEITGLNVFEDRYKALVAHCLEDGSEFGLVWLSRSGLHRVGCACVIEEVLEQGDDDRFNIIIQGTKPFTLIEREERHPYPAGAVEFLEDRSEQEDETTAGAAHESFMELLETATNSTPQLEDLDEMSAYEMAATVDFGPDAKQGLLDLRSENARMRFVTRLFHLAAKRLEQIAEAHEIAATNGKIKFHQQ